MGGVLVELGMNNESPFALRPSREPAGVFGGEMAPERSGNWNVSPARV
jgi:hypothetical protein